MSKMKALWQSKKHQDQSEPDDPHLQIKMQAMQDAYEYDDACKSQTDSAHLNLPPHRYKNPDRQNCYTSHFWAYLLDLRNE